MPKQYKTWQQAKMREARQQCQEALKPPYHIDIQLYGGTRARDGDNITGAYWDALVKAKILVNDNLMKITGWSGQHHTIPKGATPYAIVTITEDYNHASNSGENTGRITGIWAAGRRLRRISRRLRKPNAA